MNLSETVFFVFLLCIALFVFFRSAFFNIEKIEVVGTSRLSAARVREIAGITCGRSIFKVKTAEVEARLRRLTLVKDVRVVRKMPRTIVIHIEERRPLVLLFRDGAFWEVDGDGVLLARASLEASDLPLVTGTRPGDASWPAAARVARSLNSLSGVRFAEIHSTPDARITAYTTDGIEVRLGTAAERDLREQVAILGEVLKTARERGGRIVYIDLSEPGRPVVKYGEG